MEAYNSGNPNLDEAVKNWLAWDESGSASYIHIKKLAESDNWEELSRIMLKRLSFGTAGIRGKMGPG